MARRAAGGPPRATTRDCARHQESRAHAAAALGNLGTALAEVRRFDEAISTLQEAAAIFRQTGDRHAEGMLLANLGVALREVRRFDEAISAHQEAAAIFKEAGDRQREAIALYNLESARAAG